MPSRQATYELTIFIDNSEGKAVDDVDDRRVDKDDGRCLDDGSQRWWCDGFNDGEYSDALTDDGPLGPAQIHLMEEWEWDEEVKNLEEIGD